MRLPLRFLLLSLVGIPPLAAQPPLSSQDSAFHVLNRLAFGPRPGDLERVAREGVMPWIERQLAARDGEGPLLRQQLAGFALLRTAPEELLRSYLRVLQQRRARQRLSGGDTTMDPAERQAVMTPESRELRRLGGELQQLVMVRATLSEQQLSEVLADFWSNHFNVFAGNALDRVYLPDYIETTIRPRVLGSFADLLVATAKSPAMLVYLDNAQSVAPGSRPPPAGPRPRRMPQGPQRRPTGLNENYARELMELHSLGVDGGYTQADVTEVARALTGWSVAPPLRGGGFAFNGWAHDRGAKTILGVSFPAGHGEDEGQRLLQLLAGHAATAHFIAAKLCARFVSDTPPDGCIDDAVRAWQQSAGDIRSVLRAIFRSPDFWASARLSTKVKTPLEFMASAVRAVGGVPDTTPRLALAVARLGQPLYQHVAPNGYGEHQEDWVNSGALLNRMNVAMALAANRLPGVRVDLDAVLPLRADPVALVEAVNRIVLGGRMSAQTQRVILEQIGTSSDPVRARALAVGLALGGPEFQRQ